MRTRLMLPLALSALLLVLAPAAQAMPSGGYFSLGLGGGVVSGERGVPLIPAAGYQPNGAFLDEIVRTDFGSGFAFHLHFGYTIEGYVSLEAALAGHGNPGPGGSAGAGHVGFQLRYHFINHFVPFTKRKWDFDVFFGGGYTIGGYHPDPMMDDDGKGWTGWHLTTGAGFRYQVSKRVSLGVDLKTVFANYGEWIANWNKDWTREPVEVPSTTIFIPTLEVIFHL